MSLRLAHVSYVLTPDQMQANQGADYEFMASPLHDPMNLVIMGAALVAIVALVYAGNKLKFVRDRVRFFRGRTRSYQEYVPLILRLCLGVALIGAAGLEVWISPAVSAPHAIALIELILGVLLIIGFALTPVAFATLALGVVGLILYPELIDNLEFITVALAVLLLGQAKPGVDDLLGLSMFTPPDRLKAWVPLILRLGLGLGLMVMAVMDKLVNPHWFGMVVEDYGLNAMLPLSTAMWVLSATLVEFVLGFALVIGYRVRVVSLLTLMVLGLTFFMFGEAVFAHVTIFGTLVVLLITGAGQTSLDHSFTKPKTT